MCLLLDNSVLVHTHTQGGTLAPMCKVFVSHDAGSWFLRVYVRDRVFALHTPQCGHVWRHMEELGVQRGHQSEVSIHTQRATEAHSSASTKRPRGREEMVATSESEPAIWCPSRCSSSFTGNSQPNGCHLCPLQYQRDTFELWSICALWWGMLSNTPPHTP